MKSVSVLLLLVSSVLLSSSSSSAASRPPALLSLVESPLTVHLLRLLQRRGHPADASLALGHSGARDDEEQEEQQAEEAFRGALKARRAEPPLSIDLTFHLLRNMIHMAKLESQREQALLNRKVLDEVGK